MDRVKKLKLFSAIGGSAVLVLGTAAHFFYELSENNFFLGTVVPVNESTWEHMKLSFFPMLLFSLCAKLILKKQFCCAFSAGLYGTVLSTVLIPVIFYTYSGILGCNTAVLNILTFAASVLAGVLGFYFTCKSGKTERFYPALVIVTAILAFLFIIFTCFPPGIGLFKEP